MSFSAERPVVGFFRSDQNRPKPDTDGCIGFRRPVWVFQAVLAVHLSCPEQDLPFRGFTTVFPVALI